MRFEQKIGTLTRISNTQVTLQGQSLVKLGGLFYNLNSPSLLTNVSGIGGLDTGAIAASAFYYVYAVSNGSIQGLVASLSAVSPVGFNRYKKVGAFYTNASSQIFKSYVNGELNKTSLSLRVNDVGTKVSENFNFATTSRLSLGVYQANFIAGIFAVVPVPVITSLFNGDTNRAYQINQVTEGVVNWRTYTLATSPADVQFTNLVVEKQGVDAIQPDWKDY